jgi:hypothetical protein
MLEDAKRVEKQLNDVIKARGAITPLETEKQEVPKQEKPQKREKTAEELFKEGAEISKKLEDAVKKEIAEEERAKKKPENVA